MDIRWSSRAFQFLGLAIAASLANMCLAAQLEAEPALDRAWALLEEHQDTHAARALLDTVDQTRYANEVAVYRGVALWYEGKYQTSLDALLPVRRYFDKRYVEIRKAGGPANGLEREDEYDYFRLHAYLVYDRRALNQIGTADMIDDALSVLQDMRTAAKATAGFLEPVNSYALSELRAGRPERALGGFLELYSILRSASLANIAIAHDTEYNIACSYARMREASPAIRWLRKSMAENAEQRWQDVLTDKDLDSIRNSAEFKAFIASRGRK